MLPNVFNCVMTSKIRSLKSVHTNVVGWELMVIVDKEDFSSDDDDMFVLWRFVRVEKLTKELTTAAICYSAITAIIR